MNPGRKSYAPSETDLDDALYVVHSQYQAAEPWIRQTFGRVCIYCADLRDHKDHLLPSKYTGPIIRRNVPVVPACRQCNLILSDHLEMYIESRALYVASRLRLRMEGQATHIGYVRRLEFLENGGAWKFPPEQFVALPGDHLS